MCVAKGRETVSERKKSNRETRTNHICARLPRSASSLAELIVVTTSVLVEQAQILSLPPSSLSLSSLSQAKFADL